MAANSTYNQLVSSISWMTCLPIMMFLDRIEVVFWSALIVLTTMTKVRVLWWILSNDIILEKVSNPKHSSLIAVADSSEKQILHIRNNLSFYLLDAWCISIRYSSSLVESSGKFHSPLSSNLWLTLHWNHFLLFGDVSLWVHDAAWEHLTAASCSRHSRLPLRNILSLDLVAFPQLFSNPI